jgi:hypothetical protein
VLSSERDGSSGGTGIVTQNVAQDLIEDFGLNRLLHEVLRALL